MDYWHYSHLGIVFIITFFVFFYIGSYLDKQFGTDPLFTFTGLFLGFSLGLYKLSKETETNR